VREGLDLVYGHHLLMADNPEQFAEKIELLIADRQLYQILSTNGRGLVKEAYGWDRIAERLMGVYADLSK